MVYVQKFCFQIQPCIYKRGRVSLVVRLSVDSSVGPSVGSSIGFSISLSVSLDKESKKIIIARILSKLVVSVAKGNSNYVSKFQLSSSNSLGDMRIFVTEIDAYRLTEYNFNFQCKQKIQLTCLLGYLFIQSFFTFFGLRSS